jgi:hypothetical protein
MNLYQFRFLILREFESVRREFESVRREFERVREDSIYLRVYFILKNYKTRKTQRQLWKHMRIVQLV